MSVPRVECDEVVFASDSLRVGEYANAFRVMADSADEVVLDFLVYSAATNVAKVVSRVRVQRTFLALIDARLREAVVEFEADKVAARDGIFHQSQTGKVYLMGPESGEDN